MTLPTATPERLFLAQPEDIPHLLRSVGCNVLTIACDDAPETVAQVREQLKESL